MANWNHVDLLDLVECYAEENGLIASEQELSERFDAEVLPFIIEKYGEDDAPAINEGFSDWADHLTREGELHPEQYHNYGYVGRLSDD